MNCCPFSRSTATDFHARMQRDDLHQYRDELDEDEEIQATFRRLRRDGHSRLEAVRMILDVLDLSLADAKRILYRADTWAEAREEEGNDATASPSSSVPPAPG